MDTPILTKQQQKKTLSAKKKAKKVTIKNILASPYVNYWPLLNTEDCVTLNEVLSAHLVKIKQPKVNVPWSELKTVARENRKAFRLNYNKFESESQEKNSKSAIVLGVNETAKLLETNAASSILISGDVNPQFMVKHVLDMAVLKNTPILIVPNLKSILKEKTGIASLAIAFKANTVDSNYCTIDEKIKEIHSSYPVPSNHINFQRRNSVVEDESKVTLLDCSMDLSGSSEDEPEPVQNFYLYRKSKSERAFVPTLSQQRTTSNFISKMDVDSSGILMFDDADSKDLININIEPEDRRGKKRKASYKSLVIKRISNNKDRDKKKIEMLKGAS